MSYGKLYHLITTNTHTAWNFGDLPRLHLVFSTYADDTLDNEISKLTQVSVTSQNFKSTIKNQGADKFSLFMLYPMNKSQWSGFLKAKDWLDIPKNEKEFNNLSYQKKKELFEKLTQHSDVVLNTFVDEIVNLLSKN
jgi:hypothetical protein